MTTITLNKGAQREFVKLNTYPDGSPRINFPTHTNYDSITIKASDLNGLMSGLFLVDAFAFRGIRILKLILPFVPGARQDRINESGDFLFTLKSVAREVNARHFDHVVIVDPHSMVTPALIENARVLSIVDIFKLRTDKPKSAIFDGWDGVIAPDAGAQKRAFDVAQYLNVPFYQAEKHRDVKDGKLSDFAVDVPGNARYLVVDDICDGGGTFNGLSSAVNHNDTTLDLWVTHGIFSQGTDTLLKNFGQILTTDTTDFDKDGATVLSIMDRIL